MLTTEQRIALDAILAFHNVTVIGQAGTGKSFIISEAKRQLSNLGKSVAITASTGIAASQLDGAETLHRFAGILDGRFTDAEAAARVKAQPEIAQKIKETDVLIVDEVSLVSAKTFDQVEYVCRKVRENNNLFGGLQVILLGDFLQLQPIPDNLSNDPGHHVFRSKTFSAGMTHKVILKTVIRQADSNFSAAINEMERGKVSEGTTILMKGLQRPLQHPDAIHLFGTNLEVDLHNLERLDTAIGNEAVYKAEDIFGSPENLNKLKVKKNLRLKVHSPVVLLRNLSSTLVNGLQGTVVQLDDNGPFVDFPEEKRVQICPISFSLYNSTSRITVAERTQVPLALGYAFTVHKSQGMTLDHAIVHCRNMRQAGQIGVAVGRVRSTDGLQVLDFRPQLLCLHPPHVLAFSDEEGAPFLDNLSCCQTSLIDGDTDGIDHQDAWGQGDSDLDESGLEQMETSTVVQAAQSLINDDTDGIDHQDAWGPGVSNLDESGLEQMKTSTVVQAAQASIAEAQAVNAPQLLKAIRNTDPMIPEHHAINECVEILAGNVDAASYINTVFSVLKAKYEEVGKLRFLPEFHKIAVEQQHKEGLRQLLTNFLNRENNEEFFPMFHGLIMCEIRRQVVALFEIDEERRGTPQAAVKLPQSAFGKVRHVGGWAVAKIRYLLTSALRRAIDRGQIGPNDIHKKAKLEILEALTVSQSNIEQTTVYPSSLEETARRQNLTAGLTNVTDTCFEFFVDFEEKRQVSYKHSASGRENTLELVKEEMLADEESLHKFKVAVFMYDPEVCPELMREVFLEVADMYLRATDKEYVRRLLDEIGKKKTMEHRKKVLIKARKNEPARFSLETVLADDRETSIKKLKVAVEDKSIEKLKKRDISSISETMFSKKISMNLTKMNMINKIVLFSQSSTEQAPQAASTSASTARAEARMAVTGKGKGRGKRTRDEMS